MVFGKDLVQNVYLLAEIVDHIEIVLFHTPDLHNIPRTYEIQHLKRIKEEKNITYSVHLPASLEIASSDKNIRKMSIQFARDIIKRMNELRPLHHIIHIPFTTPTLTPQPDVYFTSNDEKQFYAWTPFALDSLKALKDAAGQGTKILVENINYSPSFLNPLLHEGLCELCLDLGHLLLGRENVTDALNNYLDKTEEIHLHGVIGYEEHLSLSVLPGERVAKWVRFLRQSAYRGIVNLEVFTPGDLEESMGILTETIYFVSQKS
ncbi:MAG: TIM barrel protein [Deltaproteobacteria bacterium]|nr:MAG: TIM barrel protein [Deltaproteobacteria bacterium]